MTLPGGWEDVAAIALALPGAERATSRGRATIRVGGRMFVCAGRSDNHFVLPTTLDEAEMLMSTQPDCFYQTPHYAGWGGVLVRYATADRERVTALVERAWRRRASKAQVAALAQLALPLAGGGGRG